MQKITVKIDKGLISQFTSYPSVILVNMLLMSDRVTKSHLINDDHLKHISQNVSAEILKELISRN